MSTTDQSPISQECQLNSIDDTIEMLLTICVDISVGFIIVNLILGIVTCCIARSANTKNDQGLSSRIRCHQNVGIWIDRIQLPVAALLAIVFIVVVNIATVVAMNKRIDEQGWSEPKNVQFFILLIIVYSFSFISCIDILCCQFCRDTCGNYFGRSKPWNRFYQNASSSTLNGGNLRRLGLGSIGGESAVNYRHSDASTARTANQSIICSVSRCIRTVPEHRPVIVNDGGPRPPHNLLMRERDSF